MADDDATVAALRLEVARLNLALYEVRLALGSALLLEKFWRVAYLLGTYGGRRRRRPPEADPPLEPPAAPRKYGEGQRAMRREDEPRL